MRFTHRRCRAETEGLADAAARQTENAENLAESLMVAEHAMEEVVDACTDVEYATTEADIPAVLRERLVQADLLPSVEADLTAARAEIDRLTAERDRVAQARTRMLEVAHEQGRLARTFALLEGVEMGTDTGLAAWLLQIRVTTWTRLSRWGCQDTSCLRDTRELIWHPDAPEQAHLACECGRVWPAGPEVVDRGERETREHRLMGTHAPFQRRWSQSPTAVLEAIDRALPTPAQCRDREAVPA